MLVSLCLRLKWHAAWTSNLLCFMLIMDPLLQSIAVLFRKMGQTPDSSVSAAKFAAIPRGWCTQEEKHPRGAEACRPAGSLLVHAACMPFSMCSRREASPEIEPCRKILTVPKQPKFFKNVCHLQPLHSPHLPPRP